MESYGAFTCTLILNPEGIYCLKLLSVAMHKNKELQQSPNPYLKGLAFASTYLVLTNHYSE